MPKRNRPGSHRRPSGRSSTSRGPSPRRSRRMHAHARRNVRQRDSFAGKPPTEANPKEPTPAQQRAAVAVACLPVLLGASIAMAVVGLIAYFSGIFSDTKHTVSVVLLNSLLGLGIGVRMPQRFAMWLCSIAWRRFVRRGEAWEISSLAINHGGVDRPLYWVVLSVIALASGVVIGLLPLEVRAASATYGWMLQHFFWTAAPLAVLQLLIVFAVTVIPMSLCGLAVSCAHHLSCRYGQWNPEATGRLLIGAAVGTWLGGALLTATGKADPVLFAAALPALVVAVCSAASTAARRDNDEAAIDAVSTTLPMWVDRWPTLLRASIVTVAGGGVCAAWVLAEHVLPIADQPGATGSVVLLSLGFGVSVGCETGQARLRSIGGFGAACAVAGVVLGLGVITLIASGLLVGWWLLLPASASLAFVAFAVAYGSGALLNRVAGQTAAGATILARVLVAGGLAGWVVAPALVQFAGGPGALAILALGLLALGGTLILFDPDCSTRTRRARLLGVLGSIGAVVALSLHRPGDFPGRAEPPSVDSDGPAHRSTINTSIVPSNGTRTTDNGIDFGVDERVALEREQAPRGLPVVRRAEDRQED